MPSAPWEVWSLLPMASVSAGGRSMPKAGWHSGHKESRSPRSMGGGLRAPLPYLGVSHQSLTGEPGSGGLPLCISLQPSPHQDNSEPAPTWYLWFLGSLAQAPGAPTDTSWDLQRDRVSWQPAGTGTWGCGPPLGGGSQSVQGNFIQLEIHPHRVPLPWSYPWLERSSKPQVSPPCQPCHVTVYSSSRWFLQIS